MGLGWNPVAGVSKILANILALWSLLSAQDYFQSVDHNSSSSILFKPHPGQLIGILRFIGLDSTNQILENNMVELLSGEGKSFALGISSCFFAL